MSYSVALNDARQAATSLQKCLGVKETKPTVDEKPASEGQSGLDFLAGKKTEKTSGDACSCGRVGIQESGKYFNQQYCIISQGGKELKRLFTGEATDGYLTDNNCEVGCKKLAKEFSQCKDFTASAARTVTSSSRAQPAKQGRWVCGRGGCRFVQE